MRRRKSPRVVWLPQTNANSLGVAGTSAYQIFSVDVVGQQGDFAVGEIPLTIDAESDPLAPAASLSDVENAGYRLRRIVGKIWVRRQQEDDDADSPARCIVTAGIIVRRADETTGQSFAALTSQGELMSPGQISNAGDPWVWRRSWILDNTLGIDPASQAGQGITNNWTFIGAGLADGAHVDQKTARVVSSEERLFLNVSATVLISGLGQNPAEHEVVTDLRVLASMRMSSGNRRNASR